MSGKTYTGVATSPISVEASVNFVADAAHGAADVFIGNPLIFALLQANNSSFLRRIWLITARFTLLIVKVSDFQLTY